MTPLSSCCGNSTTRTLFGSECRVALALLGTPWVAFHPRLRGLFVCVPSPSLCSALGCQPTTSSGFLILATKTSPPFSPPVLVQQRGLPQRSRAPVVHPWAPEHLPRPRRVHQLPMASALSSTVRPKAPVQGPRGAVCRSCTRIG